MKKKEVEYKEVVYNQDLPVIEVSRSRHISNFEVERDYIRVKAHTIQECKKIYNEIKE